MLLRGDEGNGMKKCISAVIVGLNAIVVLFSLGSMGIGAYMQTNDWGSFSGTHVADISSIMILVGSLFVILSSMNLYGMYSQNTKSQRHFISGRRVLVVHHLIILLALMFELYSLSWIMYSTSDLRHGICHFVVLLIRRNVNFLKCELTTFSPIIITISFFCIHSEI